MHPLSGLTLGHIWDCGQTCFFPFLCVSRRSQSVSGQRLQVPSDQVLRGSGLEALSSCRESGGSPVPSGRGGPVGVCVPGMRGPWAGVEGD